MNASLIPASPKTMIPWITEALESGPLDVQEILSRVEVIGERNGYRDSTMPRLKKALAMAKASGTLRNGRKGWWALPSQESD